MMNEWHQTKEGNLLHYGYDVLKRIAHDGSIFFEIASCFSTWYRRFFFLRVDTFTQNLHLISFSHLHLISCPSVCLQQWHHAVLWMGSHKIAYISLSPAENYLSHRISKAISMVAKICLFATKAVHCILNMSAYNSFRNLHKISLSLIENCLLFRTAKVVPISTENGTL
jgi:hypothetical protein